MEDARTSAFSRRELLKRGAVVGGLALWTTPLVQTYRMTRAFAADTSSNCLIYCIVWTPSIGGRPSFWELSEGDKCLPCPPDTEPVLPPDISAFTVVYDDMTETYTVSFPDTYSLLPAGDPTPDDLVNGSAALRRGENTNSCVFVAAGTEVPGPAPGTVAISFGPWNAATGDRIELVIKGCA